MLGAFASWHAASIIAATGTRSLQHRPVVPNVFLTVKDEVSDPVL